MRRRAFARWRESQALVHGLREREAAVREGVQRRLAKKALIRWTRKLRILDRKRHQKRVNLWARVVGREVRYGRVLLIRSRFAMRGFFERLKTHVQLRDRYVRREFFRIWRLFIARQKRGRECGRLARSFAVSRCLGRWRVRWERNEEERQVEFVRKRVVEKWKKQSAFRAWLGRAIESFRASQMKAIRLRKILVRRRCFLAWKHHCELQNLRAADYSTRILLRRIFPAFVEVAKSRPSEKAATAAAFHSEVLKRRFFNRLRMVADQKHTPLDDGLDDLISILNSQPIFRPRRLK
jgi:hypothetical protein